MQDINNDLLKQTAKTMITQSNLVRSESPVRCNYTSCCVIYVILNKGRKPLPNFKLKFLHVSMQTRLYLSLRIEEHGISI